jgi:hypothetical protein
MATKDHNPDQVAWTVKDWRAAVGGISQAYFYEIKAAAKIRTKKCGGKRLVLTPPLDFVESLPEDDA